MSECHSFDVDVAQDVGINSAIIFKSFCFWLQKNSSDRANFKDGDFWAYASAKGLESYFPYFTARQISYAIDNLVEKKYLKKAQLCDNKTNRTNWYALDEKGKSIYKIRSVHSTKLSNGNNNFGECNIEDTKKKIIKEDTSITSSLRSEVIVDDANSSEIGTLSVVEDNQKRNASDSVSDIFDHWKRVMKSPRSRLDDKRKKLISSWLRTYSAEELKLSITGCSLTPHNMGENDRNEKYNSIELILRDAAHIERFMHNAENPPVQKSDDILNWFRESKTDSSFIDITPKKETSCLKIL